MAWEREQVLLSESEVLSLSPASVSFRLCDVGQILDVSEPDLSV